MLILDLDFSASETPSEEGCSRAWELDDRSSSHWPDDSSTSAASSSCTRAVPLNLASHPTHVVLDLGCTLSIGSRAAIKRFQERALYYGITTAFCRSSMSFVFANSATETCSESCIIHFPTTPPCSTRIDVLETDDVPILFSLSQMKILAMTTELDSKWRQTYISNFRPESCRLLHNRTYCVGLDGSCVPAKVA